MMKNVRLMLRVRECLSSIESQIPQRNSKPRQSQYVFLVYILFPNTKFKYKKCSHEKYLYTKNQYAYYVEMR